jgi:ATP-dependent Lon protease
MAPKKKNSSPKKKDDVEWVKDETIVNNNKTMPKKEPEIPEEDLPPVSIRLHVHTVMNTENFKLTDDDSDTDGDTEEEEIIKSVKRNNMGKKRKNETPIPLSRSEMAYFNEIPVAKRRKLSADMEELVKFVPENKVPYKFRILELPLSVSTKNSVMNKINHYNSMNGSEEKEKMKNWMDGFFRVPFNKFVPLSVTINDGPEKCSAFLKNSQKILDDAAYGMAPAKLQIMQTLAQWISNPQSSGNILALKGAMGVGKTNLVKNGISKAIGRPFEFFSLGGATDSSTLIGHSYTYLGSTWGALVNTLMKHQCMNPILYFDEVDKISDTPKGAEIASILIHLTDRTQNTNIHDVYFNGIDFDFSRCLFIFSFNDENNIHPILRDRMQVIHCSGYNAEEKKNIIQQHSLPQILERLNLKGQVSLEESTIKYLIQEHSPEEGVRSLIRIIEVLLTRINLLRILDEETAKSYPFYQKITLPCKVTDEMARHILKDSSKQVDASFAHMYV